MAEVAGRLLEEAQFGVIEERSPNHSSGPTIGGGKKSDEAF